MSSIRAVVKLLTEPKSEARKKGRQALITWIGTGGSMVLGWWPLAVVGGGLGAWLTWRWLKFRGQWGLRF